MFQGRPYRTLRIGQTLKEKIDQKHNDHDDYLWPGGEIIHGNILILSCDGHIMGIKVDPSPPPTSWVQQLTKGFECLRRTWAHKRKANTTYVAEDLDARRTGSEANAKSTGKTGMEISISRFLIIMNQADFTNSWGSSIAASAAAKRRPTYD